MVSAPSGRRGQLILVGAIIVATIVFGLSLLLNSVLYTGAAGQNDVTTDLSDTSRIDFEAKRGVRSTVLRVNHGERNVSANALGDAVEGNVTLYGRLLGEARAASMPVSVDVTYHNESSSFGYRIVQSHDDDFTDAGSGFATGNWSPVPRNPDTEVGWVTFNLQVSNTTAGAGDPTEIVAENATDEIEYDLYKSDGNVTVESDATLGGPDTSVECVADADRVLLDLYAGEAFTGDCTFQAIGNLTGPTSLHVDGGERLVGKYEIVVDRSNPAIGTPDTYLECLDSPGDGRPPAEADPCVAPVVWSANVTTTFVGESFDYDNSYNLSIYGGKR